MNGFSPAYSFPQKEFGLHSDSTYLWNPRGNGFSYESYNIPIFYLSTFNNDTNNVVSRAHDNKAKNGKFPQHGVWIHSFMKSSTTAAACYRRGQCETVGGKSVWATFGGKVDSSKKIIMAQAAYDSNAFFHDVAVGADSAISGTIGVMLAAEALSKQNVSAFQKQIIFGLFTGESWGYVGSKRFIKDITGFSCKTMNKDGIGCANPLQPSLEFTNIKFDNIEGIIELSQVGMLSINNGGKLNVYGHQEKNQISSNPIYAAISAAQQDTVLLSNADSNTPGIPPSSAMSFLKKKSTIPTVVLTEHQGQYTNQYYHSRFDDINNVNISHICEVSKLLARSLYMLANNVDATQIPEDLSVNCSIGQSLLICLTKQMNCQLSYLKYLYGPSRIDPQPSQYTSVWRDDSIVSLTPKFLVNYLTDITSVSESNGCLTDSECQNGGRCIAGNCTFGAAYYHNALSLVFDESGNIQQEFWDTESTWMESNWDKLYVQFLTMDSPVTEIIVFIFGIIDLLLSFGAVYGIRRYFNRRFKAY